MQNTLESDSTWSVRFGFVILAALSISLPIAWISLAKVLLFVSALGYLISGLLTKSHALTLYNLWTTRVILLTVFAFAASLLWTEVDLRFALSTFVKHAKLLGILLIVFLIRSRREARIAIAVFAFGQVFVLINSWLLTIGIVGPWIFNSQESLGTKYVVFAESYLDQSIMFSILAAVAWHIRTEHIWPRWLAGFVAGAALLNVFLLLPGRTGYLAALAVLSLATMWVMNKRFRLVTLILAPIIFVVGLSLSSGQLHQRVIIAIDEVQNNATQVETDSSSGWRINAWHRSIQAINNRPLTGYGVGSWTPAVKYFQGDTAVKVFGEGDSSNPHQEFLLWGVELGIGGTLLLLALLVSVIKDAWQFPTGVQRATLSVVMVIAIACFFNSALFDDLLGDFLYVTLGLLMALGIQSSRTRKLASES